MTMIILMKRWESNLEKITDQGNLNLDQISDQENSNKELSPNRKLHAIVTLDLNIEELAELNKEGKLKIEGNKSYQQFDTSLKSR